MGTEAIQAMLTEIGDLRQEDLGREERIALIQAEATLRLAEQINNIIMPVAGVSSHVLGLHKRFDDLNEVLQKR